MSIYIGTSKIQNVWLGTSKVKKIWLGTDLVFADSSELYMQGDQCTDTTGGWLTSTNSNAGTGAASLESDHIHIYNRAWCETNNLIDLSSYNTLYIYYNCSSPNNASNGNTTRIAVRGNQRQTWDWDWQTEQIHAYTPLSEGTGLTASVDISSITSGYINVSAEYTATVDIGKIWLA